MKSFLEEYGFAILAAIVIILLIAICTPVGNLIKDQISSTVDKFAASVNKREEAVQKGSTTAMLIEQGDDLKLIIAGASETDEFKYEVHYTSGGVKTKDTAVEIGTDREVELLPTKSVDANSSIYAELEDIGTGEKFISNTITLKGSGSREDSIDVTKGDLITIEGAQYRVLAMNGTQAKVLAMSNVPNILRI